MAVTDAVGLEVRSGEAAPGQPVLQPQPKIGCEFGIPMVLASCPSAVLLWYGSRVTDNVLLAIWDT